MGIRGPVLAATGFSESGDEALRQGHALAAAAGARFVVCHVLPELFQVRVLFPQDAGIDAATQDELERKAADALRTRIAALFGSSANAVDVEIESGTTHAGILATAERVRAELIVVGAGRSATRVARSASCPVLIARPSPAGGAVVGATDFSDPALPAVQMAADEARRRKAPLRLVHCLGLDQAADLATAGLAGMIPMAPLPLSVTERLESTARDRLNKALAESRVAGEAVVLMQSAGAGILEAAKTAPTSLIVVGTHGRSGFSRLALGSVAEDVINRAPCSVLVVRLDGHPPGSTTR